MLFVMVGRWPTFSLPPKNTPDRRLLLRFLQKLDKSRAYRQQFAVFLLVENYYGIDTIACSF